MPQKAFLVDINMRGLKITDLGAPTSLADAVNKEYVDDQLLALVLLKKTVLTVGNNLDTTFTLTHNLGTTDFLYNAKFTATGEPAEVHIVPIDNDTATLTIPPTIILDVDELTVVLVG